jgi:hypothetical protein
MQTAHLELSLKPHDDGDYRVETRFLAVDSRTESSLVGAPPPRVSLDFAMLWQLAADPVAYGWHLTQMLFADERLVAAFGKARMHAESARVPLRIQLRLDPAQPLLHSLDHRALGANQPAIATLRGSRCRFFQSAGIGKLE